MRHLEQAGRSNMVYGLIRCISLPDISGHPTRLDLNRMPTGYIEYQINFSMPAIPEMSIVFLPSISELS